jgi:subtilisin-like proprotein convertase family protein
VFDGADPNGTWNLWVMDKGDGDSGDLGAWALQVTAEVDVQVPGGAKDRKHKKHGKRR